MTEAVRNSQTRFALRSGEREIILVRHGSASHVIAPKTTCITHADPDLSDAGQADARDVAQALERVGISALFTSGLRRAQQTAAPVAARTGIVAEVIGDLREVHMGAWEHGEFERRFAANDPICQRVFAEENWEFVPGAETQIAFRERVARGFAALIEGTPEDTTSVAIVHAGVIAEICRSVTGSRPFAFVALDNGSFSHLVVRAGGNVSLRSFNETRHLSPR